MHAIKSFFMKNEFWIESVVRAVLCPTVVRDYDTHVRHWDQHYDMNVVTGVEGERPVVPKKLINIET